MKLTENFKKRNVAYARYQRALIILVLFPTVLWREVSDPTESHALLTAAVTGIGLLAGWMYRESIRWWDGR